MLPFSFLYLRGGRNGSVPLLAVRLQQGDGDGGDDGIGENWERERKNKEKPHVAKLNSVLWILLCMFYLLWVTLLKAFLAELSFLSLAFLSLLHSSFHFFSLHLCRRCYPLLHIHVIPLTSPPDTIFPPQPSQRSCSKGSAPGLLPLPTLSEKDLCVGPAGSLLF